MTEQAQQRVIIVGGGTAGWLTAGRLAATLPKHIKVTLIESPSIPTVGVGEGTWPTMRSTLIALGISETEFIRECDATFKQGAKFCQWQKNSPDDFYYHPLMLPQGFTKGDLSSYWQLHMRGDVSFSNAVCFQEQLCEQGLAPKSIRTPEFNGLANYAYHLDAGKFAQLLQKHCTQKLGVEHIYADVIEIENHTNGNIAAVLTEQAGRQAADMFVDCTGFASKLLGEHYGIGFNDCSDILFIDQALAVQLPYEQEQAPIATHTISTAQAAGWVWDIGLRHRRGVGYVYSSQHQGQEEALSTLAGYVGATNADELNIRSIPIKSGYREKFWHKNCVAIGLSAGFLEPLEASALVLVELSAQMLAEQFPHAPDMLPICEKRFNDTFHYRWQRIIDFLKLHYCLSERTDNAFWRDNCDPSTIPESLQELLTLWKYRAPNDSDFTSNNEVFPAASYQYVLYGMGFSADQAFLKQQGINQAFAQQQIAANSQMIEKAVASMPSHRELIEKINKFGLSAI
ncbi:tryptophan halogenase family protein [Thalassotalea euphylliae]|uniref:tryptophan halogenase family protein n=1 Tax=Thalassotalea euphylliae TaxID=1655234 RepID=UPI00362BF935